LCSMPASTSNAGALSWIVLAPVFESGNSSTLRSFRVVHDRLLSRHGFVHLARVADVAPDDLDLLAEFRRPLSGAATRYLEAAHLVAAPQQLAQRRQSQIAKGAGQQYAHFSLLVSDRLGR